MAREATPHKYNLADMQGTSADYVAYHKGRLILGSSPNRVGFVMQSEQ